jgi:hypothetical protein
MAEQSAEDRAIDNFITRLKQENAALRAENVYNVAIHNGQALRIEHLETENERLKQRVEQLGGFDEMANACEKATLTESTKEEMYSWVLFYMKKVDDLTAQLAAMTQDCTQARNERNEFHNATVTFKWQLAKMTQENTRLAQQWHDAATHDGSLEGGIDE